MDVKYDFTGKNVLITGAATGIGEGTALRFAEAGANIFIADFNDEEGQKTAAACRDHGVKTGFCHTDVSDPEHVNAMAKQAISEFGHIDFIVNNAGRGGVVPGDPVTNIPPDEFLLNYRINMLGFSNIIQAFYEHLKERQQGKVVVTASIAAFRHTLRLPHYTAAKAAVLAFMKTMAVELGNYNVNVNAIAPGWVYTPIYHNAINMKQRDPERFKDCNTSEEVMHKLAERTALHRAQTVDDMAYAIMFLCSESSKNITGHCIPIESGVLVMP